MNKLKGVGVNAVRDERLCCLQPSAGGPFKATDGRPCLLTVPLFGPQRAKYTVAVAV